MVGQTVLHYKILEKIGEGGMGVVYKAQDTRLDRIVALKFLPERLLSNSSAKARFIHEAKGASAINHSNITTVYDIGEVDGKSFIAMEYVEGKSLKELAKEDLKLNQVLEIAIQIAEGLAAAHKKEIVHRDIKSENIMLTKDGVAKIMDFGLAKLKGVSKITDSGTTPGTIAYMSPEQARGEEVDYRSDLFSLGVVLYELITGKLPFQGEHNAAVIYSICYEEAEPLSRYKAGVPEELQRIAEKALKKVKSIRYQSAADLLADLKAQRRALEGVGLPGTASKPSRKSVAVLPLKNLSGRKENEYFSDGVTEDIITQLSKIGELKVISRTSIMQYKNTSKNLRQIAKELDVVTVLEGSVRQTGGRVRIVGQLIDARTDELVWAETYDREMKDIFEIQSDVARQIAAALQAKLYPPEEARLSKKPTENLTAYDYYLKGREYYNRGHKQDNENAIALFKKALELDSNYAFGYAGLGDAYGQRVNKFGFSLSWADAAIEAGQKAISIDPNLVEGYKALGLAYAVKGWFRKALETHHKAVELNPNHSWTVGSIGGINFHIGELEEALRWMKKRVALDPTNPLGYAGVGQVYLGLGDDTKTEEWFNKALELQPDFNFAHEGLSSMYLKQGKYKQALEWGKKILPIYLDDLIGLYTVGAVELFVGNYAQAEKYYQRTITISPTRLHSGTRHTTTALAYIYSKTGKQDDAQKMLEQSLNLAQKELEQGNEWNDVRFDLATINAIQGNKDEAYRWLEKAIDAGWRNFRLGLIDPRLENLHNDERFKKMMADVKAKVDEMRKRVEEEEKRTGY